MRAHDRGRAAEHLVIADLILQGVAAVPSGFAWPCDVIAQVDGHLHRVQVKSTTRKRAYGRGLPVYRFRLRRGRRGDRLLTTDIDALALVILDTRRVAYFRMDEMIARTGRTKQSVDFREKSFDGHGDFAALWRQPDVGQPNG